MVRDGKVHCARQHNWKAKENDSCAARARAILSSPYIRGSRNGTELDVRFFILIPLSVMNG
jgi:hypothetical protein